MIKDYDLIVNVMNKDTDTEGSASTVVAPSCASLGGRCKFEKSIIHQLPYAQLLLAGRPNTFTNRSIRDQPGPLDLLISSVLLRVG